MKMNRIQFQAGLSLNAFLRSYGTEVQCEDALEQSRWPRGFICPACQNRKYCNVRHGRVKIFQCNSCRKQVTLTSGTIFHSTKLPLTIWFQALFFLTQTKTNISTLELMRRIGVCYRTSWRIKHKLMQVMHDRESTTKLADRVEIDDSYLGGERVGGKSGRGSENKIPFIAAIETNSQGHPKRAIFTPVKTFSSAEVKIWAQKYLKDTAIVVSDGLGCFRAVKVANCKHQPEVVGRHRKSINMGCFHWVNTILGNLKTSIDGNYHGFKFDKYAYRYLSEVQYRFNRRFDLASILPRLLYAGCRTAPKTEVWLRRVVVG